VCVCVFVRVHEVQTGSRMLRAYVMVTVIMVTVIMVVMMVMLMLMVMVVDPVQTGRRMLCVFECNGYGVGE
jgi:hypothetical protein